MRIGYKMEEIRVNDKAWFVQVLRKKPGKCGRFTGMIKNRAIGCFSFRISHIEVYDISQR